MSKPKLVFVLGSQAVGKSSVARCLREKLPHTSMLDLSSSSIDTEHTMYKYHSEILDMFFQTRHLGISWICSRSFICNQVYSNLGYKDYDFRIKTDILTNHLDYLSDFYDLYLILLVATPDELEIRLKRDKTEYVKFSVENSLKQQEEYKKEIKRLANTTENVKCFTIENKELETTINTIMDLILTNMIGE